MIRRQLSLGLFAVFLLQLQAEAAIPSLAERLAAGTFYVATNGNDHWTGTLPTSNLTRKDGPFASLSRAVEAARQFRKNATGGNRPAPTIFIRRGTHFLTEPLTLGPDDSGLRVSAYRDESPTLSGGRPIVGWKQATLGGKTVWVANIAGYTNWSFHELWVNGHRAPRARHPNKGYFQIASLPDATPDWSQGQARLGYHEKDLPAWPSLTNAEVVAMTRWVESRLPVEALDPREHILSFSRRAVFQLAPGDPYYIEGALDALDEPGEWCVDPANSKVYYMPRRTDLLFDFEAIAPVLTQILRLAGDPENHHYVERISFKGLAFSHTEWNFPPATASAEAETNATRKLPVGGFSQAAIGVPGAVFGEGARGCSFERCGFSHLGSYGLELARACQSNQITFCHFDDLGAGGLKIGETRIRAALDDLARSNQVSDCEFSNGGHLFQSAVGIWLGQSPDNSIVHNLIHDFYYTGISVGWTWGYGPSAASNNVVEFNHVHHIGVKSDGDGPVLSDMGGIYTLGKEPGMKILNNVWHDIAGIRYGGWGIYFDEGSSGLLASNNLVYRTTHGGFHQHYGETNTVVNNIFAFGRDQQLQRTRNESHRSFSFETNIVYFDSGALLAGDWSNNNFVMDWNVYWDARATAAGQDLHFMKHNLAEWRALGHDQHSLVADPLFRNPKNGDFQLATDSPALSIGFAPLDLRAVGPRPKPR